MRIAFLSEGATELGFPPGMREGDPWERSFALKVLVERVLEVPGQIEAETPPHRGRGAGWILKHGYAHLREAARVGARAAVLLVDADGHAHKRLRTLREHVDRVYAKDERLFLPVAIGVAVEKIEAWLLADEQALCRVLGLPALANLAQHPEELKGKRGSPDDPKAVLKACLREDTRGPRSFLEQIHAIVAEMDLDVVAGRCKSFQAFREELRREIGPLFST